MSLGCLCSSVARASLPLKLLQKVSTQVTLRSAITRRIGSCSRIYLPLTSSMYPLHRLTANCNSNVVIGWCSFRLDQSPASFRSYCTLVGWRSANNQSATRYALIGRQVLRYASQGGNHSTTMNYVLGVMVLFLGLSYAAVPLYSVFCQATGYSGSVNDRVEQNQQRIRSLQPLRSRPIKVNFNADINSAMAWQFKPLQNQITIMPGETALAFYSAKNPTDKPIDGVATYNVVPFEAGAYFNKIQCFCFEEQRLNPNEEVDMPVFFYIDPDYARDKNLQGIDDIYLSYTFFESKPGLKLPLPGFSNPASQ